MGREVEGIRFVMLKMEPSNKRYRVREMSYAFAIRVVKSTETLRARGCDQVLIRQYLKSGTSIGANIAESHVAFSRAEFAAKLAISLKEGKETEFWIRLLNDTGFFMPAESQSLLTDLQTINRILYLIIRRLRQSP